MTLLTVKLQLVFAVRWNLFVNISNIIQEGWILGSGEKGALLFQYHCDSQIMNLEYFEGNA